jgi:glycosyltransferase involved in cell wall biosynthesis
MKIALVHELLTMRGGAERVLKILADMFPDAPIYTLLYDEKKLGDWFPKSRIRTSNLQKSLSILNSQFSIINSVRFNHHLYLSQFPRTVEAWDFSDFDLVLSTSSAFVHGIITNSTPKHLCYVHSPARYLWDRTHDVVNEASKGLLGPLKKMYLERTFHKLRVWDSEAADRPDRLLAASKTVQRRIELYWRRDSEIVYPPIDDFWFSPISRTSDAASELRGYLIVSSLVRYKRIDLAIKACNELKLHLKIVGEGPDMRRLKSLAGPTVEFYGWRKGDELKDLYTNAIATIFPGDEDFGLVPLESMACGTPVIAFKSGGALETMIEGQTGEFFAEPTSGSLQQAMKNFDHKKYSKDVLLAQAKKFSRAEFEKKIRAAVAAL